MTTPTREQVIEWAKEAGFEVHESGIFDPSEDTIGCTDMTNHVTRLAIFAMSAGRDQGLREAAAACEVNAKRWPDLRSFYVANECAAAIEQLRGE